MNIVNFYIHTNIFLFSNVFLDRVLTAVGGQCPISKQGNPNGEATMFQVKFQRNGKLLKTFVFLFCDIISLIKESWTHGKTGACGFAKPTTSHGNVTCYLYIYIYKLLVTAEGFFTAVGSSDWEDGLGCGTCAKLEYQGNTVTVNVVDRWGQEMGGTSFNFVHYC